MNKDLEHLKMLSTGYFVYSAITAFFACIPFVHLFLGIAMISGAFEGGKNPPPPMFGWLFVGIGGMFIVLGWALAISTFIAGKYIRERKSHTFCFVIACINCMFAPLGTVLGVLSIIVLLRDSVKESFNLVKVSQVSNSFDLI